MRPKRTARTRHCNPTAFFNDCVRNVIRSIRKLTSIDHAPCNLFQRARDIQQALPYSLPDSAIVKIDDPSVQMVDVQIDFPERAPVNTEDGKDDEDGNERTACDDFEVDFPVLRRLRITVPEACSEAGWLLEVCISWHLGI